MKIKVNENREILCSDLMSKPVIGQFNDVLVQDVPIRIAAANNFGEEVRLILCGCNPDSMTEVLEVMRNLMRAYGTFKNKLGIYD